MSRGWTLFFAVSLLAGACSSSEDGAGTGGSAGQPGLDASDDVSSADAGDAAPDGGDAASDSSDGATFECPRFAAATVAGNLDQARLEEVSGLVVSRKQARVLWMHNDSGNAAEIFAVRDDGQIMGTFALGGATATDWEDIAVGPGPLEGADYLYVADIGDNDAKRSNIVVYRVAEPTVDVAGAPVNTTLDNVEAFKLAYPDGAHNAETLLVDPRGDGVFIVTKSGVGASRVYRAAALGAETPLEHVGSLAFGSAPLTGGLLATGGDIGTRGGILLRTETSAFYWRRSAGQGVADALMGEPCPVPLAIEYQGEAIGFAPDEAGYFTASEDATELNYYAREP